MTEQLTDQQRDALDRYYQIQRSRPEIFEGRERRPIIMDRAKLETYAAENGIVLGVAFETPYLWLLNDLVQSRTKLGAVFHPYLRFIAPPDVESLPGVVIVATTPAPVIGTDHRIIMVKQERHATGKIELELPRGFGEPGCSPAEQALRELRQETGYVATEATYLGSTLTDSGTSDRSASFFHVQVADRISEQPEVSEAITEAILVPLDELWNQIDSGLVRDAFTLQALALYQRHLGRRQPGP